MTFEEAYEIIKKADKFGMILGLQRIEELLEGLGNPEKELKAIHIAGTNGKGSVSAYISNILMEAGFRVGRYNSPSIFEYRERIRVNNENVSEEAFGEYMDKVLPVIESMQEKPTVFEIETAVAFMHFKAMKCDYVVLEAGLGGRLDSTNVIKAPLVSVITPVDYDHMYVLGNSLAEIAGEKAGIIKAGRPVVIGIQTPEAMKVLETAAGDLNAAVYKVGDNITLHDHSVQGQTFDYKELKNLHTSLLGDYQIFNAAAAVETIKVLQAEGVKVSDNDIRQGIANTIWHGRFEIIGSKPLIIIDGGHNPQGAASIRTTAEKLLKGKRIILVMGVFKDKDHVSMLEEVKSLSDTMIVYSAESDRGLKADILNKNAKKYFKNTYQCGKVEEAVSKAKDMADPEDAIIIFGTLSSIGRVFAYMGLKH